MNTSPTLSSTSKLIALLYGTRDSPSLAAEEFRHSLAASGVRSFQLNVDDAAVVEAMRFGPGDGAGNALTGFISVWTDDIDLTVSALQAIPGPLHIYRVTEHRRLDPPPTPDGERAEALANVAVLRRPGGMSRDEYLRIWLGDHTAVAIRTQASFGYIQNVVEEPLTEDAPIISAIVEELFPMAGMTDPHEFYGSNGDEEELERRLEAMMTSIERFGAGVGLDLVPTSRYRWDLG